MLVFRLGAAPHFLTLSFSLPCCSMRNTASPVFMHEDNITRYKNDVSRQFAEMGLNLVFSPNSFLTGPGGLAGTDAQRASDVNWAFNNQNVQGIIANRGGWGCNRIVDLFDYEAIKRNPKYFMGYSDLTGCISAITSKTGLETFHGPMGIDQWTDSDNGAYFVEVAIRAKPDLVFHSKTKTTTLVPGVGRGRLLGGNMSVFTALLGSPYFPLMDEPYILFLEETEEATYRVDRMLTSLHTHGMFKNAQGLVFGQCTKCPQGVDFSLVELLQQKWGHLLGVPSFYGAEIGHIDAQFTLPFGGLAEINATAGTLKLTQAAVL